jgi:hypothetical protein
VVVVTATSPISHAGRTRTYTTGGDATCVPRRTLVELPGGTRVVPWPQAAGVWSSAAGQGPVHCGAEPTRAGLWFSRHDRTVWRAFACDNHADDRIAPRPLLPRDRDALNRRRDKRRTQLAGHSGPENSGPENKRDR